MYAHIQTGVEVIGPSLFLFPLYFWLDSTFSLSLYLSQLYQLVSSSLWSLPLPTLSVVTIVHIIFISILLLISKKTGMCVCVCLILHFLAQAFWLLLPDYQHKLVLSAYLKQGWMSVISIPSNLSVCITFIPMSLYFDFSWHMQKRWL